MSGKCQLFPYAWLISVHDDGQACSSYVTSPAEFRNTVSFCGWLVADRREGGRTHGHTGGRTGSEGEEECVHSVPGGTFEELPVHCSAGRYP